MPSSGEKVKALQREWASFTSRGVQPSGQRVRRRKGKRFPRGRRTPEEAFRRPILEALVELGGSAPLREVLKRVEGKMASTLTPHDREPLPSDPKTLRWKNTAQWCRNTLVREGLMKGDSPHGLWEISEAGREWLRQNAG